MSSSGEVETQAPVVEQPPAAELEAPAAELEAPAAEAPAEQPEAGVAKEEEKQLRERKRKAPKEKKPKAPAHPPYFQMIKEAITALNEKGGSSPYAIAKYMEEKHKSVLPANFRKILGLQLKNSVAKGNLIKIKASYKLSDAGKREKSAAATTKAARANAGKPKENKKRRPKSKAVSKIDNPHATSVAAAAVVATTRARRSKRSAPAKPKQLKSIKSPVTKKAKKASA